MKQYILCDSDGNTRPYGIFDDLDKAKEACNKLSNYIGNLVYVYEYELNHVDLLDGSLEKTPAPTTDTIKDISWST